MEDEFPEQPAPPERVWQREETEPEPAPKMGFETKAAQASAALGDDLWDLHAATARLLEFTTGRDRAEYDASELLQGVVQTLLNLAAASLTRLHTHAPETAARLIGGQALQAALAAQNLAALFTFVQDDLQALNTSAAEELDTWHSG